MCIDDRNVWVRHLENSGKEAALTNLIAWMTTEIISRMRATALIRNVSQSARHPVGHISSAVNGLTAIGLPPKCWICQNSTHWMNSVANSLRLVQRSA